MNLEIRSSDTCEKRTKRGVVITTLREIWHARAWDFLVYKCAHLDVVQIVPSPMNLQAAPSNMSLTMESFNDLLFVESQEDYDTVLSGQRHGGYLPTSERYLSL